MDLDRPESRSPTSAHERIFAIERSEPVHDEDSPMSETSSPPQPLMKHCCASADLVVGLVPATSTICDSKTGTYSDLYAAANNSGTLRPNSQ